MSFHDVTVPDEAWSGDEKEGVLSNWFFRDGARVRAGEPIAEIMVAKVEFEITAPVAGALTILVPQDGVIQAESVLGKIDPA